MLRPIASMSALVARSQASLTTPLWISRRASVRSSNEMAPRCIRSWMTRVMLVGSPGRTKAPPLTPFLSSTLPAISTLRSASPTAPRLRSRLMDGDAQGERAAGAVREEADRLDRRRVFLVTNRSLAQTPQIAGIAAALGGRHAGSFAGVAAHGPRQCVIEGAAAARAAGADLLVAVGGGSVVDASKVMQLCLRHGISEAAALSGPSRRGRAHPSTRPPAPHPCL